MTRTRLAFMRLQAFDALAQLGSFKAAREKHGGSNVSEHVAELQDDLGTILIKSSPRGELTPEGKALSLYLSHHFDEIASLLDELREGQLRSDTIAPIMELGNFRRR